MVISGMLHCNAMTKARAGFGSCVDGALRSSTMLGTATIAVGCSHVSGLLVQPFFTTAGPDMVREVGPNHVHGVDTP